MKKILLILNFIIGFSFTNFAQNKTFNGTPVDPPAKLVKSYPNPATTVVNFEFQQGYDKSFSLQIYNFMGKKVTEFKSTSPKIILPLQDFFRGVYIYQLRNTDGKVIESGKFQVVKN